jgi:hypothetical protein
MQNAIERQNDKASVAGRNLGCIENEPLTNLLPNGRFPDPNSDPIRKIVGSRNVARETSASPAQTTQSTHSIEAGGLVVGWKHQRREQFGGSTWCKGACRRGEINFKPPAVSHGFAVHLPRVSHRIISSEPGKIQRILTRISQVSRVATQLRRNDCRSTYAGSGRGSNSTYPRTKTTQITKTQSA